MATYNDGIDIPLPAAGSGTFRNHLVAINASGQAVVPTTAGSQIIGVGMTDSTGAGQAVTVRVAGVAKLLIGATVNEGNSLKNTTSGTGTPTTTTGDEIGAIALTAGASGNVISVLVTPATQY